MRPSAPRRRLGARRLMGLLALALQIAAAGWWWSIQRVLTDSTAVALAYTIILTLGPPALISFLIPWSPAGMLLAKLRARTWGTLAVALMAALLVVYTVDLQLAWWAAQPVAAGAGIIVHQMLLGLIGFVFVPALLWTPVGSEELTGQIEQAHLVRRYELQTQADLAILRGMLLRAQSQALLGMANLTVQEREELAGVMRGLVRGIDQTLEGLAGDVEQVDGVLRRFAELDDTPTQRECLTTVVSEVRGARALPQVSSGGQRALPQPAAPAMPAQEEPGTRKRRSAKQG